MDGSAIAELTPLLDEIWSHRHHAPTRKPHFSSVAQLGERAVERGQAASSLLRDFLAVARAFVETAESQHRADAAVVRQLAAIVDEAAVQLAAAVENARRARRQSWLSFLSHELKNPLNTILNALWLLREKAADKAQSGRFAELGERAVRRLEERVGDLRGLDDKLVQPPPGWQGHNPPSQP
jgi:signal transduction histidine kinase